MWHIRSMTRIKTPTYILTRPSGTQIVTLKKGLKIRRSSMLTLAGESDAIRAVSYHLPLFISESLDP
jgi:hypothetical protein